MKFQIVQAAQQDISWIANLEGENYSPKDAVPESVLINWFARNPHGFSVIANTAGERVGHVDVLPLIPDLAAPFLQGEILEREIPAAWIVPANDRTSLRDLYVESIIIKKQTGLASRPALYQVFEQLNDIARRICEPSAARDVCAIEASAAGKKLMLRAGFERCEMKTPRRDGHELFKIPLGQLHENLRELSANVRGAR